MDFTQAKQYPIPMYKDLHQPKWASSTKEENNLVAEGWTAERGNIPPQRFPRAIYRIHDGAQVNVGDYDRNGVVDLDQARADLDRLIADGTHSLTPVKVAVAVTERTVVSNANGGSRMDVLEERMDNIEGTLGEIMQILREQNSPRRKSKAEVA